MDMNENTVEMNEMSKLQWVLYSSNPNPGLILFFVAVVA